MALPKKLFSMWLTGLFIVLVAGQAGAASLPDFTDLVEKAKPAVVNISTEQTAKGQRSRRSGPEQQIPDIFKRFFGDDMFRGNPPGRPSKRSLGSGFIISEDGYILTNNHVIKDADKIIVRLIDRREFEAEVIGGDARSDLALLKIDADDLPVVEFGDSDELEVGEWVLAIGSPFGFDYSVTAGIVSAIGRSLPSENYVPFIQTDVAINPGNSGGPLFNMDGEVVGINSQIYTRSGGFMGLSFAIPMRVALNVTEQLKDKGSVSRGWLGVVIQDVSRDLAESFGLDKPAGALVAQVLPDSPAEDAGLKEGDVITQFDGEAINLSSDLPHMVGRVKAGSKVPVKIMRNGRGKIITVKVGDLPSDPKLAGKTSNGKSQRLGMTVGEIDERTESRTGVSEGVLVLEVGEGDAADAGLRAGDIVSMINHQQVSSVRDFNEAVDALPAGRSVPLRVFRNGRPGFIPLKISEK